MTLRKIALFIIAFSLFFSSCKQDSGNIQILYGIEWQGSFETAPDNPAIGWAYYNTTEGKSYIFTDRGWQIIAQDGIGIVWKGELYEAPLSPEKNWAYFNITDGNSYIYNGLAWDYLAKSGKNGTSGILKWLGSYSATPQSPNEGDAYYNTVDGCSYIYADNAWNILSKDGVDSSFNWLGSYSYYPSEPEQGDSFYYIPENTAYTYNDGVWEVLVSNSEIYYSVPFEWKGELSVAPSSPSIGWMYYNTSLKTTYIYDGTVWQKVVSDGVSPEGFLIKWEGTFSSYPSNPVLGSVFYNIEENKLYLFDGIDWNVILQGADGIFYADVEVSIDGENITSNSIVYWGMYDRHNNIPLSKTVTIKNVGTEKLILSKGGPVLTDYASSNDIIIDLTSFQNTIDVGESTSFDIIYAPNYGNVSGGRAAYVSIYSNALNPNFIINIRADSNLPSYYVSTSSSTVYLTSNVANSNSNYIMFEEVTSGYVSSINIVSQGSDLDFDVSIEGEDSACFKLEYLSGINKSKTYTISFASSDLGRKEAVLIISGDSFHYTVPIYAEFIETSSFEEGDFYENFNSSNEIFFDGKEGDGDDYCYLVFSDGDKGKYILATAYERVSYSSGNDLWLIHLDENDNVIKEDERDFDFEPTNYDYIEADVLSDGRIAVFQNNRFFVINTDDSIDSYTSSISATKILKIEDNQFYSMDSSGIYRYDYNGKKLSSWTRPAGYTLNDFIFIDGVKGVAVGYVSNHEATDSAKDAFVSIFDLSGSNIEVDSEWFFDAGHGDEDLATSVYFFKDKIYVLGTSEDYIDSKSEIDGWIKVFDSDLNEIESGFDWIADTSISGNFFTYNDKLYIWNNSSNIAYLYDIDSRTIVSKTFSFSYSKRYYSHITYPFIFNDYLYIAGYATESQTKQTNGYDGVVKRYLFNF